MAEAQNLATLLVSFAIFILGGGLVVGALLLFLSGNGLLGVLALLFGIVALAGGLFFNLSPIVAGRYRPEDIDLLEAPDAPRDAAVEPEDVEVDDGRPAGPPSAYDTEPADDD